MHIVLCGSMSAARSMIGISETLQKSGHVVVLPENIEQHAQDAYIENASEKKQLNVFKTYFELIKNADAVLIVNESKGGLENYIGPNSLIEMAFAYVLGKRIYVLNAIPHGNSTDEIEAMHPIELHGSLELINE